MGAFCSTCGSALGPTDRFCSGCGSVVADASTMPLPNEIVALDKPETDPDFADATQLVKALSEGWRPPVIDGSVALSPTEGLVAEMPCAVDRYTAGNLVAGRSSFLAFGSPALLLASLGGSVAYNLWRQRQHDAYNAAQWREENQGLLLITKQRLAVVGEMGWSEFDYSHLRSIEVAPDGVVLLLPNQPRTKLRIWKPLTNAVMIRFLAFGEVPKLLDQ